MFLALTLQATIKQSKYRFFKGQKKIKLLLLKMTI